jgi:hypothetical protein
VRGRRGGGNGGGGGFVIVVVALVEVEEEVEVAVEVDRARRTMMRARIIAFRGRRSRNLFHLCVLRQKHLVVLLANVAYRKRIDSKSRAFEGLERGTTEALKKRKEGRKK